MVQIKKLVNKIGTVLAKGYTRIVVGDFGAYVECSPGEIVLKNIESKFPGEPSKPVKYLWLQSKDKLKTKIHEQRNTVRYADYKVGIYYIEVSLVDLSEDE